MSNLINIKEGENGPNLHFVHAGFNSTEGAFGMYNFSWGSYLASLKKYIESGKGEPNTTWLVEKSLLGIDLLWKI